MFYYSFEIEVYLLCYFFLPKKRIHDAIILLSAEWQANCWLLAFQEPVECV